MCPFPHMAVNVLVNTQLGPGTTAFPKGLNVWVIFLCLIHSLALTCWGMNMPESHTTKEKKIKINELILLSRVLISKQSSSTLNIKTLTLSVSPCRCSRTCATFQKLHFLPVFFSYFNKIFKNVNWFSSGMKRGKLHTSVLQILRGIINLDRSL